MTYIVNRKKKGISTVLTTLIIVVASVVLGTAVTLFGTSLFQTGATQQAMSVANSHVWISNTDNRVEGALVVRNTGDKLIAVDGIKVRGAQVAFTSWFAAKTTETATGTAISNVETTAQFIYLATATVPTALPAKEDIDGTGTAIVSGTNAPYLAAQSGPVSLEPGKSVIIYFIVPAGIVGTEDVGAASTLTVTAGSLTSVQSITVANV